MSRFLSESREKEMESWPCRIHLPWSMHQKGGVFGIILSPPSSPPHPFPKLCQLHGNTHVIVCLQCQTWKIRFELHESVQMLSVHPFCCCFCGGRCWSCVGCVGVVVFFACQWFRFRYFSFIIFFFFFTNVILYIWLSKSLIGRVNEIFKMITRELTVSVAWLAWNGRLARWTKFFFYYFFSSFRNYCCPLTLCAFFPVLVFVLINEHYVIWCDADKMSTNPFWKSVDWVSPFYFYMFAVTMLEQWQSNSRQCGCDSYYNHYYYYVLLLVRGHFVRQYRWCPLHFPVRRHHSECNYRQVRGKKIKNNNRFIIIFRKISVSNKLWPFHVLRRTIFWDIHLQILFLFLFQFS